MIEAILIMAAELCYKSSQPTQCEEQFQQCMFTAKANTMEGLVEHCTKETFSFLRKQQ